MNLLGLPYFADAITAAINARVRDDIYRIYVTDAFYNICNFTGNRMSRRYFDILHPTPEDPRSGMEIAVDFLTAHGIPVVDDTQ